ncbi:MAG: glutamate--tRNA ligase [Candidatus Peribacteraceae bacterium]|nr:glutamate--tRNA ligase [Candidatus Peribacteraceae bacterium]MDD5741871.1 glutamate--tRNA ligase [Candidatus Peribacteraceae bacterium]
MRTRFAPSPTGFLHVGGLRTALFAWLIARQTKGRFLLRIEDTDQIRSVEGAVENILSTLHWAGIDPDEGVMMRKGIMAQEGTKGPYIQSQRLELYQKYAEQLLQNGHAYACFCTAERLTQMREGQMARKQAPMYDRLCTRLPKKEMEERLARGDPHVIRLLVPHERVFTFTDKIRGEVTFQGHTVDDQVLLKSDGFPTYHLAHVVDDHLMEIDLVIRGEEWLSSTPKHLLLFERLGWTPPKYAHVPLLLNKDRTKLSKRQQSVAAEEYIGKGYLPEALMNFLALLGWNPGSEQEIFSLAELTEAFSLERVQKAGAIFDLTKLDWLQGQWIRRLPLAEFADRLQMLTAERYPEAAHDAHFSEKAALIHERVTFLEEGPDMLAFFYVEPKVSVELLANAKQKVTKELLTTILKLLTDTLGKIPADAWTTDTLKEKLLAQAKKQDLSQGQILWPLRAALTGLPYSPGAFEVAVALGKKTTLARLEGARAVLE